MGYCLRFTCCKVYVMRAIFSLTRRFLYGFARRVPTNWRTPILSLRKTLSPARVDVAWAAAQPFYPGPWSRPLLILVLPTRDTPFDWDLLSDLQQSGWPIALVWRHGKDWWGRILGTKGFLGPEARRSRYLEKLIAALSIPAHTGTPLGLVATVEDEQTKAGQELANRMGYRFLPSFWKHVSATKDSHISTLLPPYFPLVSVLLAAYNQPALTDICLQSLYAFTDYPNWEVVAVDNGSSDETVALLERWAQTKPNFRLVRNTTNRGFPAACNQAARAATGEILCVLNNDTVVTPGWLNCLVDELVRNPRVGLVGPVSNGVANEARVKARFCSAEELPVWALARQRRYFRQTLRMSVLALFCAATWRKVWDEMGGLDEDFGVGLFEDDDLSFRLREAGYRLHCRLDAYVHHFQGSSFGQLQSQEYLDLFEHNRKLFWAKLRKRRRQR